MTRAAGDTRTDAAESAAGRARLDETIHDLLADRTSDHDWVDEVGALLSTAVLPLLIEAWDEGFDAGERDVFEHEHNGFDTPCIQNPYRPTAPAVRDAS